MGTQSPVQCCANFDTIQLFVRDMTTHLNGCGLMELSVVGFVKWVGVVRLLENDLCKTINFLDAMMYDGGFTTHDLATMR